jgi:hypothetical protein
MNKTSYLNMNAVSAERTRRLAKKAVNRAAERLLTLANRLNSYPVGTIILTGSASGEEAVAAQKHEKGWYLAQDWESAVSADEIARMGEFRWLARVPSTVFR